TGPGRSTRSAHGRVSAPGGRVRRAPRTPRRLDPRGVRTARRARPRNRGHEHPDDRRDGGPKALALVAAGHRRRHEDDDAALDEQRAEPGERLDPGTEVVLDRGPIDERTRLAARSQLLEDS